MRGFDDDKPSRKKLSPINGKPTKDVKKKGEGNQQQHTNNSEKREHEPVLAEGAPQVGDKNGGDRKPENLAKDEPKDNNVDTEKTEKESKLNELVNDHSFNFDDILKCDTIPGLLSV